MKKLSVHAVILLLCFLSVAFWEQTPYTEYSIPLIGVLILLYLLSSKVRKRNPKDAVDTHELPTIVLLLLSILVLISMTGKINSILFFLVYFLPFYLSALLEPAIVFFFAIFVIGFFLPVQNPSIEMLVRLMALFLFIPVAFFFGKEIQEKKKLEDTLSDMSEIIKSQGKKMDNDLGKEQV